MPLDNEQVSTKLAVMESQISTLINSSQRVEALLERLATFDKTQAELMQRYAFLSERIIENTAKVDKCAESHEKETATLWTDVRELKDKASKAHGISIGAMAFAGVIACIATYFLTFLFNTVQDNKAGLIRHSQQIIQLEKELQK